MLVSCWLSSPCLVKTKTRGQSRTNFQDGPFLVSIVDAKTLQILGHTVGKAPFKKRTFNVFHFSPRPSTVSSCCPSGKHSSLSIFSTWAHRFRLLAFCNLFQEQLYQAQSFREAMIKIKTEKQLPRAPSSLFIQRPSPSPRGCWAFPPNQEIIIRPEDPEKRSQGSLPIRI